MQMHTIPDYIGMGVHYNFELHVCVQTLGVKHLQVTSIITNHMLPALNTCNSSTHAAFLALIVNSGLTSSESPNQELGHRITASLKAYGKVMTTHGMMPLEGIFLHLPPSLGNKVYSAVGTCDAACTCLCLVQLHGF